MRPSRVMGIVPATCRTSSFVGEWMSHLWRERPWREEFSLMRLSVKAAVRDVDEDILWGATASCRPFAITAVDTFDGFRTVVFDEAFSSSELTSKSVRTTSRGGPFLVATEDTPVISFPMILLPQDEADEVVTTVEFEETNCALLPPIPIDCAPVVELTLSCFSIFNGIFSTQAPLSNANAFSAQLSASFSEKHTPTVLNSPMLDAALFSDGAIHTGGALIRPGLVGVNLPGAGVSS
mmetsp:Transcript_14173/g.24198  ORF Transcript_14173/g.24198 Transcript_14173/m.24198 type:complete len:237 (+) Transcript_14173:1366-2076(+)